MDFRAVDFLDFTFRLCLCRSVENLLLTSSLAFARFIGLRPTVILRATPKESVKTRLNTDTSLRSV